MALTRAVNRLLVFAYAIGGPVVVGQTAFGQTTVLPTDINRPGATQNRHASQLQLKLLRTLPAPLYVDADCETSFRIETNPFQFPTKRTILHREVPLGTDLTTLDSTEIAAINKQISHASAFDNVFRVNPNVTVGWSPTGNTQFFATYFLLRDSLMRGSSLNSTTQAVGIGAQHTFNLGKRASLQPQLIVRELYQTEQIPVLDYLPALTLTYQHTPNLTSYCTTQLQARFKHFIIDPMRELDPFYTYGFYYQRGRWTFSASTTFNQNFRHQYGPDALIPINNYAVISDFEVDRQLFEKVPGCQAFMRAEPVWNFSSRCTPSLAGMDFRLYYGIKMSAGKQALTGTMQQLRKRYQNASL